MTLTLAQAKAIVAPLGFTLTRTGYGEYRLNLSGGNETTAYYATDIDDAVGTARLEHGRGIAPRRHFVAAVTQVERWRAEGLADMSGATVIAIAMNNMAARDGRTVAQQTVIARDAMLAEAAEVRVMAYYDEHKGFVRWYP